MRKCQYWQILHTHEKEMDFRRIPSGVGPTEKIHQPFGPHKPHFKPPLWVLEWGSFHTHTIYFFTRGGTEKKDMIIFHSNFFVCIPLSLERYFGNFMFKKLCKLARMCPVFQRKKKQNPFLENLYLLQQVENWGNSMRKNFKKSAIEII